MLNNVNYNKFPQNCGSCLTGKILGYSLDICDRFFDLHCYSRYLRYVNNYIALMQVPSNILIIAK